GAIPRPRPRGRGGWRSPPCRSPSDPRSGRTDAIPPLRSLRPLPLLFAGAHSPGARATEWLERERHDLVAIVVDAEWHQHELHVDADPQTLRCREARFDPHLAGELHIADPVGHEGGAG